MDKKTKANLTNGKVQQKTQLLMGLLGSGEGGGGKYVADWAEMDPNMIIWLIVSVTKLEGAIMFGTSRRQDQFHVRILAGDKAQNFWFAGNEEGVQLFNEWCTAFCEAIEAQLG